jgi:hypothetical protein
MTSSPFEPKRIVLIDAPRPEGEDHFELSDHRHHCRLRFHGPAARIPLSYRLTTLRFPSAICSLLSCCSGSSRAHIEIAAGPGVRPSVRRLHYRPARIELSRRPRSQRRLRSAPLYRKRTIPEASAIHEQVQTNRDLLTSWNTVTPGRVNNTKSNQ